jgi:hypothetical protein
MKDRSNYFTKIGRLGEEDEKLLDYQAWEKLGAEAKFNAAWELVQQAWILQGKSLDELRFCRSVTNIIRKKM